MTPKTKDFISEILVLREQGFSYEYIAKWLAENKNFAITGAAVRSAVLAYENEKRVKK